MMLFILLARRWACICFLSWILLSSRARRNGGETCWSPGCFGCWFKLYTAQNIESSNRLLQRRLMSLLVLCSTRICFAANSGSLCLSHFLTSASLFHYFRVHTSLLCGKVIFSFRSKAHVSLFRFAIMCFCFAAPYAKELRKRSIKSCSVKPQYCFETTSDCYRMQTTDCMSRRIAWHMYKVSSLLGRPPQLWNLKSQHHS